MKGPASRPLLAAILLCAAPLAMLSVSHAGPASAPAPGVIPYMADGPGMAALAWRVLGALLVCAAVGWAAVRLLSRWTGVRPPPGRARPARRLELLEVKPLGHRGRLLVVRYESQQILLAQSEAGIALLHRGDAQGAPS